MHFVSVGDRRSGASASRLVQWGELTKVEIGEVIGLGCLTHNFDVVFDPFGVDHLGNAGHRCCQNASGEGRSSALGERRVLLCRGDCGS